jgi:hypothetical protein
MIHLITDIRQNAFRIDILKPADKDTVRLSIANSIEHMLQDQQIQIEE